MAGKALIAMSGGVDSSAAAAIMTGRGLECIGCTMKLTEPEEPAVVENQRNPAEHLQEESPAACPENDSRNPAEHLQEEMPDSAADAEHVCRTLGMEFFVLDLTREFREEVIDRFIRVYEEGGTPNPCVVCNRYMKFGLLLERAESLGCDTIVTGHYARIRKDDESGRWRLLRAKNEAKDQTYVLYSLTQEQLSHAAFPLGEYGSKEEIRAIAQRKGFRNSRKPDSQDLCFVKNGKYADYIEKMTGRTAGEGNFVDEEGNILGRHRGLIRYTIGQRNGLGLALPQPMYVKKKDLERNEVVLTTSGGLFSRRLVAEDFNWIWTRNWKELAPAFAQAPRPGSVLEVTAKPRYRAKEAPATARVLEGGKVEVLFHEPQRALTTGQAVVLYDGENVVGGGTITEV